MTGPNKFRVFSQQTCISACVVAHFHLHSRDAQCNIVKLRIWPLFVVRPDFVKVVQWSRNRESKRNFICLQFPQGRRFEEVPHAGYQNSLLRTVFLAKNEAALIVQFHFRVSAQEFGGLSHVASSAICIWSVFKTGNVQWPEISFGLLYRNQTRSPFSKTARGPRKYLTRGRKFTYNTKSQPHIVLLRFRWKTAIRKPKLMGPFDFPCSITPLFHLWARSDNENHVFFKSVTGNRAFLSYEKMLDT